MKQREFSACVSMGARPSALLLWQRGDSIPVHGASAVMPAETVAFFQYILVSPNDAYATLASWASLILRSCSSQQCGQRTRILTD
jgi:hypothetical protein